MGNQDTQATLNTNMGSACAPQNAQGALRVRRVTDAALAGVRAADKQHDAYKACVTQCAAGALLLLS